MLVSKSKYAEGDIVAFKISNGDEVIAKIVEENDYHYLVDKPCSVVASQQGIGLMQTLMTGDVSVAISINKNHIIMHSVVIEQVRNMYIQTTTGIQPVTKGGIIT